MSLEFGVWKEFIVRFYRLFKFIMWVYCSLLFCKRIYGNLINCLKEVVNCNVCLNKFEILSVWVICVVGNCIGIIIRWLCELFFYYK